MLRLPAVVRSIPISLPRRWLRRLLGRAAPQDIMKIMRFRTELYGAHFLPLKREAFRQPSWWSVEEQELFAAYVARLRQCEICTVLHAVPASGPGPNGQDAVAAALADWRSAGLRPPVAAAFRALEILVQDTMSFGAADLDELRALGAPRAAIEDLLYIGAVMSIMVRVGSALGAQLDQSYAGLVRQFGLVTTPSGSRRRSYSAL